MRVSGGPIWTSVSSTVEIAPAAVAIIWFMASDTAESSSSVSSVEPSAAGSGSPAPIIAAARRRAPSSVITNTLPPVTPST